MSDGSRTTSFAELDRASLRVADLLTRLGVRPAEHVALVMPNRPEFLEVVWGAQRSGTYWTPVNWHLTEREAAYVVEDCGARVLFAAEQTAELAARIAEQASGLVVATPADYASADERAGAEVEG